MTFKENYSINSPLRAGCEGYDPCVYKRNDIQYCTDVSSWNAVSACQKLYGRTLKEKGILFAAGCLICLILIGVTTYIQYNATFLSTYVESGVRRITLAEKLRKIPLSFFGKKDLSDLTSTIMADCATLETLLHTGSRNWLERVFRLPW